MGNLVAGEIAYIGKAATIRGRITSHAGSKPKQLVEMVIQADPLYSEIGPKTKQFFKVQVMKLQDFIKLMVKHATDETSENIFKSYNQGHLESFMLHAHIEKYGAMPVLNIKKDNRYYTDSSQRKAKGKKITEHGTIIRPKRRTKARVPFPGAFDATAKKLDF